ncbi:calcium-binding protein [Asanoa iriomotensis]|uniref:Hemolysin type calcium-binding protein n=1 Tax=Asanoa iriomotensis TaxID=234613 RepID=A0ABQ4CGS9_9ACTN|nr:hypothetical protein [Asanoa iriomotensis]GIF61949.1 hypothetical protein Air01nite_80440 [Asanoa iriomotensis]
MDRQWFRPAVAAVLGLHVVGVVPAGAAAMPPPTPNRAYWVDDSTLRYEGGIGKTNDVTFTDYNRVPGLTRWMIDDVSAIVPGLGCVNVTGDNTRVICTEQEDSISWLTVSLGMGDDTLVFDAFFDTYTRIYGGTGDDTITVADGADPYVEVYGEDGADVITRSGGDAFLRIDGGPGPDQLCAPGGYLTYANHPAGVVVSVGGGPAGDDGMPDEGDTVCAGFAGVTGSAYADGLVAGSGKINLTGNGGADVLVGGAGDDTLFGGGGDDLLYGLGGDDWLVGETGTDTLNGGAGPDDRCDADGVDTLTGCEDVY